MVYQPLTKLRCCPTPRNHEYSAPGLHAMLHLNRRSIVITRYIDRALRRRALSRQHSARVPVQQRIELTPVIATE